MSARRSAVDEDGPFDERGEVARLTVATVPLARVAVLGAGSWGTAFAKVLADAGTPVTLWARRPELAAQMSGSHENPDYLPGIRIPAGVAVTSEIRLALDGADAVVFAVPAQTLRGHLAGWSDQIPSSALLVSLMKGIELGTSLRMSQVIACLTGAGPERIAVLSGPNLAREIAAEQPAATVVACQDPDAAARFQQATATRYFRPYTNSDVVGCELGGAVKNVIALAVGIAGGMGLGDNTRASIITRGLAETARLGAALGADPMTFAGLAGLGDLAATCMSPLSRNRSFGEALGRGAAVSELLQSSRQVAEGVKSCQPVLELAAKVGVEVPIIEHVAATIHDGMAPVDALVSLMGRDVKSESS
jgi:glycerol-3-phosphate dehydrogenase (NAD(P)+)